MDVPWLLLPPGAGLPGAALTGPELAPGPELLPWPATTLWTELVTDPATEPTAELTGDVGLPPPEEPAVSALRLLPGESGVCAAAGFWSATARPAMSTPKTSAAANAPHAYRQTLRASSKARERVADPSTAHTLPPEPIIMHILLAAGLRPSC
jgi:hypothetical protein